MIYLKSLEKIKWMHNRLRKEEEGSNNLAFAQAGMIWWIVGLGKKLSSFNLCSQFISDFYSGGVCVYWSFWRLDFDLWQSLCTANITITNWNHLAIHAWFWIHTQEKRKMSVSTRVQIEIQLISLRNTKQREIKKYKATRKCIYIQ